MRKSGSKAPRRAARKAESRETAVVQPAANPVFPPDTQVQFPAPWDFKTQALGSQCGTHTGLLVFMSPGCGWCRQLAPQLDIAAASTPSSTSVMAVDATDPRFADVVSGMELPGWPTMKLVRRGNILENAFDEREAPAIVYHLKSSLLN
jgi:thiol-disulfide isomerase/thioredoxin